VKTAPMLAMRFYFLEFGTLFRGEIRRHFAMRFRDRFVDAAPGAPSDFFKLSSSFIGNRGDFRDLLVGEMKLPAQVIPHPFAEECPLRSEKEMARVRSAEESAGHSAGKEDEDEADDQFPFQHPIHCKNSS